MRRIFLLLVAGTLFVSPLFVSAQLSNPLAGPLVPCDGAAGRGLTECQVCHVVTLGQRIINFLVGIASFLAVVLFAYAGWLMLTAAGDTGKVSTARGIFTNVIVGLVIVLAGWLIIDTVMKWAFEGSDLDKADEARSPKSKFGPWNALGSCLLLPTYTAPDPSQTGAQPGVGPGGGRRGTELCPPTNPYCSPAVMEQAGFTDPKQANAMSCIAMTESSGFPNGPCSKNKDGTDNACGLFQITRGNWANPALHRNQPCSTDRRYIYDAACNRETAYLLFQANRRTPYSDWTGVYQGQVFNPAARKCVETYDRANVRWQI